MVVQEFQPEISMNWMFEYNPIYAAFSMAAIFSVAIFVIHCACCRSQKKNHYRRSSALVDPEDAKVPPPKEPDDESDMLKENSPMRVRKGKTHDISGGQLVSLSCHTDQAKDKCGKPMKGGMEKRQDKRYIYADPATYRSMSPVVSGSKAVWNEKDASRTAKPYRSRRLRKDRRKRWFPRFTVPVDTNARPHYYDQNNGQKTKDVPQKAQDLLRTAQDLLPQKARHPVPKLEAVPEYHPNYRTIHPTDDFSPTIRNKQEVKPTTAKMVYLPQAKKPNAEVPSVSFAIEACVEAPESKTIRIAET